MRVCRGYSFGDKFLRIPKREAGPTFMVLSGLGFRVVMGVKHDAIKS